MKRRFEDALRRYGTQMILQRDGKQTAVKAFLQPVRAAGAHDKKRQELGTLLPNEAVYLGPADVTVEGGALLLDGTIWRVRRWERIFSGDEAVYLWAALTREGEANPFA